MRFGGKNFFRKRDGNLAIITALVSVPMLLVVSLAVDSRRSASEMGNLQDALDVATLAAVSKGGFSKSERERHAEEVFYKNYSGNLNLSLSPTALDDRVTLKAEGQMDTLFSGLIGKQEINVSKSSTAELLKETVTCLLILSKNKERALVFEGSSSFNSPNCAIQVNSKHPRALWSETTIPPVAHDICVTGGVYGKFGSHVKTECRPVEDPYAHKILPSPGSCDYFEGITQSEPFRAASHRKRDVLAMHKTKGETVLHPGHYCGGIELNDDVTLMPGLYHISDGALVFGNGSKVYGKDVSFILRGKKGRLHMQEGAQVDITASYYGELGGIAFYQVPSNAVWPDTQSLIRSDGHLSVNGVFYFPASELRIYGTARVGANAKATSFIADTLRIDSDVKTTISVDHRAAGLPPLQPRTDEGARIVTQKEQSFRL